MLFRSDHVDPARAGIGEPSGHLDRVGVVDGLCVEVTAQEPDRVTTAQVDGRVEVYNRPLVDGTPVPSMRTASRRARATPLKEASITW